MLPSKQDFEDNKLEVGKYFDFLKHIEDGGIYLSNGSKSILFEIDVELINILKANAFLLLYNLVESTIRNALWDVHQAVRNDRVSYKNLILDIKKVLIDKKVRAEFKTKEDTLTEQIYKIIELTFDDYSSLFPLNKAQISFEGGNLHLRLIQETFGKYGITGLNERHTDQVEAFKSTKRNRNYLAHGEKSFKDCGKDYGYIDLLKDKDEIIDFLDKALFLVENFINQRAYKVQAI
jgi:hypothetical protein